ncbi:hypothetical protein ABLO03_13830, partial [Mycobacterium tuberculosis]
MTNSDGEPPVDPHVGTTASFPHRWLRTPATQRYAVASQLGAQDPLDRPSGTVRVLGAQRHR